MIDLLYNVSGMFNALAFLTFEHISTTEHLLE